MSWYIPKHHITFSIWGTTMCSKCSMNLRVNWVLPHPEGPLTMNENGCLHDGSILQNEDESGLKVILIFITLYTQTVSITCSSKILCTQTDSKNVRQAKLYTTKSLFTNYMHKVIFTQWERVSLQFYNVHMRESF